MASASRSERTVQQDYIARIRYSNALPPPPLPPKLLEIPNTGLASGHYTSAGFASRLAREQPLNIEADAELGMPIDLVGWPGVFNDDESALLAPDRPPSPHPHDKLLLRPLASLGKPSSALSGVSFLRRTEYITAAQPAARFDGNTAKELVRPRANVRRKPRPDEGKDDPASMLRAIVKGFDLAYPEDAPAADSTDTVRGAPITPAERDAWANPRHPTKPQLTLLDSYPIIPHFDATPDTDSFVVAKFITNPVAAADYYDERLEVGLLRPTGMSPEATRLLEAQQASFAADPTLPAPIPQYDYEFFLPSVPAGESATSISRAVKRTFELPNAKNTRPGSGRDAKRVYRYERVRAYETYQQTGDAADAFGDTVALALHDGEARSVDADGADGELQGLHKPSQVMQKAAYYYPVAQRTFIRPRRVQTAATGMPVDDEDMRIDVIEFQARDATTEDAEGMDRRRIRWDAS